MCRCSYFSGAVPVWGNCFSPCYRNRWKGDPGFIEGNSFISFILKIWKQQAGKEFTIISDIIKGTSEFVRNESSFVGLPGKSINEIADKTLKNDVLDLRFYPNPFNNTINIKGNVPESRELNIDFLARDGLLVRLLIHKDNVKKGIQSYSWDGTNGQGQSVSTGIYFLRVRTLKVCFIRRFYSANKSNHSQSLFKAKTHYYSPGIMV